jgi:RimJ/RimL family protein N-acetyltransferase
MRTMLIGEKIRLTALQDTDAPCMQKWFDDVYFMRHYDMVPAIPKSVKSVAEVIEHYSTSGESCVFAIRPTGSDNIIGVAGYDEIIWTNGAATLFIGIGDKGLRGQGLGREALGLLLDFGFNELNFHKIQLCVLSYNTPAIRLYEGGGFIKEGTYREFILRDGQRHDMYLYGLLRSEWLAQATRSAP